jgi:CO/xanthine dehydrogenase FAD-binding subunit
VDLNQIKAVAMPRHLGECGTWEDGDAWLAGGTWLFSEPQPVLRRLIDLSGLGWDQLLVSGTGLEIGATCTIARLEAESLPERWAAAPLVRQCCRALLGSFKIWNMATVGGNICMALPAGPMTSLATALDAIGTVIGPDGAERTLPIIDLVIGPHVTSLRPGEALRRIDISAEALSRRTAFRRISLSPVGRSGALLIGTLSSDGAFGLNVTAATRRPVQLRFPAIPDAARLEQRIRTDIPDALYFDDMHGLPDWRRHMTFAFAEEIRLELASAR